MIKKLFRLLAIAPLLLAIQCFEEEFPQFEFNNYKIQVSPSSAYSFNDTIWIEGRVSSRVYDLEAMDSVFTESPLADVFSVYQFIEPSELSNCKDAIDKFELIFDVGEFSFLPRCENAQIQAMPKLSESELNYSYRIGLKPLLAGDYVISLQNGLLQNENRNVFIINDYLIANRPNEIGFDSCGQLAWRYLDESDKEFFLSVEQ